jgi:hypothetical protein
MDGVPTEFDAPRSVRFEETRWHLHIIVTDANGVDHEYVASADAGYTEHDGIWFGTHAQWVTWLDY